MDTNHKDKPLFNLDQQLNSEPTIRSPIHSYLESLLEKFSSLSAGEVASYIPELSNAKPEWFGISIVTLDGHVYQVGDTQEPFSIQSISKPFTYGIALESHQVDKVLEKIGVEPSGDAFNSISLDPVTGKPLNPMINAGAIASAGLVPGNNFDARLAKIMDTYSKYIGHEITIDEAVYTSESATGHRNRAIGHMLRNFDILQENLDETLELYFKQCAISVNCRDLSMMAATLANGGVNPVTGIRAIKEKYVDKVLSVMTTCGMYDYAGGWIYDVGLPAKSGVAGGVIAVLPGQLGIAIFSPPLDEKGNSVRGIAVCEKISNDFNLHMFNSSRSMTSVIRAQHHGKAVQSGCTYCPSEEAQLNIDREHIKVWELLGDLIFSSTEYVLRNILHQSKNMEFCIIDFKRVINIDNASAKLLFHLYESLQEKNIAVIFANIDSNYTLEKTLKSSLSNEALKSAISNSRESALKWCEDKILERSDSKSSVAISMKDQPLCKNFSDIELNELSALLKEEIFPSGSTIFSEQDKADCLYFLMSGEVSIQLNREHKKSRTLATLYPGNSFGEMALIESKSRSATAITEKEAHCFRLDFSTLSNTSDDQRRNINEKLISNLATELSSKLRKANETIRSFD